ncbi:hypothetical protein H4217_008116, partial [Coemansia sp. RSA 1939]
MSVFTRACPYLARTGMSVLQGLAALPASGSQRALSTSAADQARCGVCPGHTGQSALLAKASECPVVGPSIRASEAANASASANANANASKAAAHSASSAESAAASNTVAS